MKNQKINITRKQAAQYNMMLASLKRISKQYQTPAQLRRNSEKQYGLGYEETLEMAYENLQTEAANASKGIKPIVLKTAPATEPGRKK